MSAAIELESVAKRFGAHAAVDGVTLTIGEGEFFSLLGPSGCGKTTTLRMIAGFVEPDEGRILLHGNDVTRVPPNRRPVNMVFQQYALFPHTTTSRSGSASSACRAASTATASARSSASSPSRATSAGGRASSREASSSASRSHVRS